MALELPTLVQRLVLDASGFRKGTEEAEDSFRRAATASERAGDDMASSAEKNYAKATRAAQESAEATNKAWAKSGDQMKNAGRDLTTFVTVPLLGLAAAAIKTAGEFESTMNTMKAVAGVPGPEIKKLGALAKQMGADTVFSANESAEAMLNLAKAGISTSDIMGGAVQATLSLAAAGNIDLAFAATVAGNAMNTFGLEGKDAATIADALAGAANASSADISDLALALSQGGLAAHAAGLSIQETTAVLAAFADAGIRGSDAGTSLKTFLLNLVPSAAPARKAMEELGLSFTDAEGNFLSIGEIADQLKDKTAGLSDETKTLALQVIFGSDAYRAALVLSEQGAAGLDNYTRATSEQGTAAEVADARMQGWAGTWESFKGSLETAALSIGEVVIPAITPLVDKVKELADAFTNMDPSTLKSTAAVAGIAAAAGPALWITGSLAKSVSSVATAMSVSAPQVLLVVGVVAALTAGMILLWNHSETFRTVATAAWEKFAGAVGDLWRGQIQPILTDFMRIVEGLEPVLKAVFVGFLIPMVANVVAAFFLLKGALEVLSTVLNVVANTVELVGRNLAPVWGGIQEGASLIWRAMQGAWNLITLAVVGAWHILHPIWYAMQGAWNVLMEVGNALWKVLQGVWNGITEVIVGAWHLIHPIWYAIQGGWNLLTDAANALWLGVQGAWNGITEVIVGAWHVINPIWQAVYGVIHDVLAPIFILLKAIVMDVFDVIQGVIGAAWDIIEAYFMAVYDFITKFLIPKFLEFQQTVDAVWDVVSAAISYAWETVIEPVFGAIVTVLGAVLGVAFIVLREVVTTVWDAIGAAVSFVWNMFLKPIWEGIAATINEVLIPVFNYLKTGAEVVWEGIATVVERTWATVSQIWDAIYDQISGPLTTVFNTFKDTVSTVWEVFAGAASRAWGTVNDVISSSLRFIGGIVSGFLGVVGDIAGAVGLNHVADALHRGADAAGSWGQGGGGGATFAEKGYGYASGGPLPVGYGFKTSGAQAIVGEGNPMYPEYVIPTDPKYRSRAEGLLHEAQSVVWPGMAKGGLLSKAADLGSAALHGVTDLAEKAVGWTAGKIRQLGRFGLEQLWREFDAPDEVGGMPPAGMNSVRQRTLDMIWDNTPDGIGSGWQEITGYLDSIGQPYTVTSTTGGAHTEGSFHGQGKAVDMVGDMAAIFNSLASVNGINELFYDPAGYFIDNGTRHDGAIGGHNDHVHAATFDSGGIIPPHSTGTWTNNLGVPEVVTPMASGGWLGRYQTPDLADAPMFRSPWTDQPNQGGIYIAPGAFVFNPTFEGDTSPAIVDQMMAKVEEAFNLFILNLRQGVHS